MEWERLETSSRKLDKMGTIKYRNSMNLAEIEDIKKRWQENTENYTKRF